MGSMVVSRIRFGHGQEGAQLGISRLELEMTASLDTLVIAAYVFADSFGIPRRGPVGKITDAESSTSSRVRARLSSRVMRLRRRAAGGIRHMLVRWKSSGQMS